MFENRFADQVAIVTGGASGIGRSIGERLAAEGARVVLLDLNAATLDKTVAEIGSDRVTSATLDVTDEASVSGAIKRVAEQYGRLDIAVNSAGIPGPTSVKITDYSADDFDRVIRVNLRGSFLVTKYAVTHMLPRNYGRILLIASMSGKDGNPGMIGYTSSKAAVIGMVKGIGKEFAETGITVNGLAPAVIRTPMNENTSEAMLQYMIERIPMHRLGTVEEVASIATWILSPEATFNTGVVFDLSGGRAVY
jgi:NAD(P)-dependent dehydrogenase (short-subunit alcohol dehydrogenase family)